MSAAAGALVSVPHRDGGLGVLGVPRGAGMVVAVGTVSYWTIYPGSGGFTLVNPWIYQGAALGSMVGLMSYGKRQFEDLDPIMRRLIPPFHEAMEELVAMVDADSRAFSSYMVRTHQRHPAGKQGAFQLGGGLGWCTLDSLGAGL